MLVFDERHQVDVLLALDDEDALAGVPVGVRVFQDVEQVAALNVKDDVLELLEASVLQASAPISKRRRPLLRSL